MNLLKVERYKNYHRIEYYLSFLVLLVPIILAISMRYTDTANTMDYAKPGAISLFTLVVSALGMASSIGIFHVFFAVIAANTLALELESRYYMMYFPKISSKKKLLGVKQQVVTEALLIQIVIFLVIAFLAMKFFIVDTERLSTQVFDGYSFYFAGNLLAMIAELVAIVQVSVVLGLFLRPLPTILTAVGIFFAQLIGSSIPIIQWLMPKHYLTLLMELTDWTNRPEIIKYTLLAVGVCAVIAIGASLIGRKRMEQLYG